MKKMILHILIIILLAIIQLSFIPTLVRPFNNFNLILGLLIFLVVILDFNLALWYALGTGLLLEMFSVYPFGLVVISLLATLALLNWLFNQFFSSRSYYSLVILGIIGFIFYDFLIVSFSYLFYILKLSAVNLELNRQYFINFGWHQLFNLVELTIAWLFVAWLGRKYKIISLIEK